MHLSRRLPRIRSRSCPRSAAATLWFQAGLMLAAIALPAGAQGQDAGTPIPLLDEIDTIVRERFFDPALRGVLWSAKVDEARRAWRDAADVSARDRAIDRLLASLETSHTARYTPNHAAYFQLGALFRPSLETRFPERFARHLAPPTADDAAENRPVHYVGVGWFTRSMLGAGDAVRTDGVQPAEETVVIGVLEGFPAAGAGVQVGDVVLAFDGQPYAGLASFADHAGRRGRLTIRRHADQVPLEVEITPRVTDAATMFEEAMRASARVIEHAESRIGYVRPWSYGGRQYQDVLEELVQGDGLLASADALVLDLRGGWGGADPSYLRLFQPGVPRLTSIQRDGTTFDYDPQWRKPLVALADGGTRSGKELLIWGIRRYALGTVVGSRTAGAVVAGSPFLLSDGSLLYLAVADVRVDGERLEGRGVAPDIDVPFEPRHAAGADPQLDRAIREAASQAGVS